MDKVYDYYDFVQCVGNVGEVVHMHYDDFYLFEKGLSESKLSKSSRPLLADVYVVEFRKGSKNMFYMLHNENDFKEADFLKVKTENNVSEKPPQQKSNRGINSKKKNGLIKKILPLLPENRRKFYEELPINEDAVDLVYQRE